MLVWRLLYYIILMALNAYYCMYLNGRVIRGTTELYVCLFL